MANLTLFFGDSDSDEIVKQMLEGLDTNNPSITFEYRSIHASPMAVLRLGITDLPALVMRDEIIAQGSPEKWLLSLLERVVPPDNTGVSP